MPNLCPLSDLDAAFSEANSIALLSHIRPDGDAIGSILALGHSLEQRGKSVVYLNNDGCPESLAFLPGSEKVQITAEYLAKTPDPVDLAIACDTATQERLGKAAQTVIERATKVVNIDHHVSNPGYGDLNYIDDHSPATGEIVYDILTGLNYAIPAESRDSIYVATSTDTGSFQYTNTTEKTYRMAADLVAQGLDVGKINELTYDTQPFRKIGLLRALLNTLEVRAGGQVATWNLTNEVKTELSLIDDDTEGMIDHIRAIQGVIAAVFFEEIDGGKIRVSIRSKDVEKVPANEVCGVFGGGGHRLAAGIRMAGPLESARQQVLTEIERRL